MLKQSFIALGALLLTACATTQNYNMAINSWVGGNINNVTRVWGYPTRQEVAPSGNRVYVYDRDRSYVEAGYFEEGKTKIKEHGDHTTITSTPSYYVPPRQVNRVCTTWFEVNGSGRIVNTSARGNDCVGTEEFLKRMGNPANMPQPTR